MEVQPTAYWRPNINTSVRIIVVSAATNDDSALVFVAVSVFDVANLSVNPRLLMSVVCDVMTVLGVCVESFG